MILDEETYKTFGYYASELPPYSNKQIVAQCNNCKDIKVTKKRIATKNQSGLCKFCTLLKMNNKKMDLYVSIAKDMLADPDIHYITIARKYNLSPYNIHRLLKSKYFNKILIKTAEEYDS